MRYQSILLCFAAFLLCKCIRTERQLLTAPTKSVFNSYHDTIIEDQYRYMENLEDTIVLNWLALQNKHTDSILSKISGRQQLLEKLQHYDELTKDKITNIKVSASKSYYYIKTAADTESTILYYRKDLGSSEEIIFDSKNYKPTSGQTYLINYYQPSWDGKKIAISLTKNDEEFSEVIIFDVPGQQFLKETIDHCWPSELGGINWLPDNSGFIYTHIPEINTSSPEYILNTAAVLYRLHTDPKKLHVLFSKKTHPELALNPEDFPMIHVFSKEQKYIFGRVGGIGFKDYYYTPISNLSNTKVTWSPLFKKRHKVTKFSVQEDSVYFLSAKDAPNFKICSTVLPNVNFDTPKLLVPEDPKWVIKDFALTKETLYFTKTKNGVITDLFKLKDTVATKIDLPKSSGNITLSSINEHLDDLWVEIESWISHKKRYHYNHKKSAFKEESIIPAIDYPELDNIVIKEIEITSHDGTSVPLSIIYKKGLIKDGTNRVLLNGYGSYGWINAPLLYPYLLHWIGEGGTYAVAHVRGGGEKGDRWHSGAFKTTKPNTWKDFIACTEYLISEGYTTPKKIAVWGGSAGGINIGRAITERPDLYAAAVIRVGLLNTLRSEIAPNGQNNVKEFGSVKDSTEFEALLRMDAYHHIKKGTKYPAVLLTSGLKDSRVVAWQPAKFAAKMQAANASERPVLLSVNFNQGHGFDRTKSSKQKELADIISFVLWQTAAKNYQLTE